MPESKDYIALMDRTRYYRGEARTDLLIESDYHCSHPFCDYPYLPLKAHHIIQYSKGGLTTRPNGLILCKQCHKMVHDGMVPKRLQLLIKATLQTRELKSLSATPISADDLISRINAVRSDTELDASEKFHLLNDILVAANFLSCEPSRFAVFGMAIACKVGILNDGVSPLRSNLGNMLLSMNARRKWAQVLAANAIWYAQSIRDTWLTLYFMHSRAVGFNARNDFPRAVRAFKRAIDYLDSMTIPIARHEDASQLRARLIREMAVCRAKITQHSKLALKEVERSLDMSSAAGEPQGIFDALNRCIEAFVYEGELLKAESYLDKLMSSWGAISDHSKAIAMKMHGKLLLAQNKASMADEVIQQGLDFSLSHKFHHQIYHFKRLQWNRTCKELEPRTSIIT